MQTGMSFAKASISCELARRMLLASEEKAAELGLAVTTCVVDESGVLKAFSRMDGSPLAGLRVSMKKAITAVGFGLPSGQAWYDFVKDDPILTHGAPSIEDFTMLGGGFPIVIDGMTVGAIGVAGGHYKQDVVCAQAALALLPPGGHG